METDVEVHHAAMHTEKILKKIDPVWYDQSHDNITQKPYETLSEALSDLSARNKNAKKDVTVFLKKYQKIDGRYLWQLPEIGISVGEMVEELEDIVDTYA